MLLRRGQATALKTTWLNTFALLAAVIAAALIVAGNTDQDKSTQLLNVSYDPTCELFVDLNRRFAVKYENETGRTLIIKQSHGGSGRQARAVIDSWSKRLPHDSSPWTSTIVFVVRRGNPFHIRDWPDLVGASVITPNPKTSGNGKLSLLAAWGSVGLSRVSLDRPGAGNDSRISLPAYQCRYSEKARE